MEENRPFIPLYVDFVDSKTYTRFAKNPLGLYWRMRRYVCRARSGHSLSDFYIKGYLATAGYLESYATALGVNKSTVSRWLSELEDAKFVVTYRKAEKGRGEPNIWLLGIVHHYAGSKWGNEAFFADHDAMAQEEDDYAPEAFDSERAEVVIASAIKGDNLTVAYLQRSTQQTVAQTVAPVQPINIKEKIGKENTSTPSERKENFDQVRARALRGTLTTGEDEVERSDLATYIGQQMHSPLPQGDCKKLAMTYTEQTTNGKRVHKSPDDLWKDQPLFKEYVVHEISYHKRLGGSLAGRRKKLVNLICSYKSPSGWGWLDWKEKRAGPQTQWQDV